MELRIIARHTGWWEVFNGNLYIGKFWNKGDRWAFLHGATRPKRIPHNLTSATEIAQWMALTERTL